MNTPASCWPQCLNRSPTAARVGRMMIPTLSCGRSLVAGSHHHRLLERRQGSAVGRGQRRGRQDQRHQSAGSRDAATGRQPAVGADRVPVELQLVAHRRQRGRRRGDAADDDAARVPGRIGRIDDGQHRLLHQRRIDQRKPAGRHLHHQPQGGLERWRAHHMGRHRVPDQRNQRQEQGLPHRQPQRRRPRRKGDPRRRRPPGRRHLRQALLGLAGNVRRATPCCCPRA